MVVLTQTQKGGTGGCAVLAGATERLQVCIARAQSMDFRLQNHPLSGG
jgi:hypothetical protein